MARSTSEQEIVFLLENAIGKEIQKIPTVKLKKELGEEMVKIVRERTHRQKTITSSKMKSYKPDYIKRYKTRTGGPMTRKKYGQYYLTGKVGNKKGRKDKKTEYASYSKAKMLQLTGNLFSSFKYRGRASKTKTTYTLDMELYVKGARNQKVSKYVSKLRPYFGLAISGAEKRKETIRLNRIINKYLKSYTKIKIETK